MKQNKELQNQALISENIYDDGKHLWFAEFDYNALYKLDKTNREVKLAGIFPDENFMQERLYVSSTMNHGKLYFAPYTANEIAVYDTEKELFEKLKIVLKDQGEVRCEKVKFFRILTVENEIYFIPAGYPGILCYKVNEDRFLCFDEWIDSVEKLRVNDWGYFLDAVSVHNRLILPCACADAVVIFDLITKQSQVIPMGKDDFSQARKYCGIHYVDEYFYFISTDGTIIKRKLESEQEEISEMKLPVSERNDMEFYPVQYRNGWLYLFPFGKNKCFKVKVATEKIVEEKVFAEDGLYEGNQFPFLTCVNGRNHLYLSTGNKRSFIEYDDIKGKKIEWKLYPSDQDKAIIEEMKGKSFIQQMNREELMVENTIYSLTDLLNTIQAASELKKKEEEMFQKENICYLKIKNYL